MPEISPRYWVMVAALGFTWGGTFLMVELALRGMTPFWLAAGRISFASLLLTAVWASRGFRLFEGARNWPVVVLVGVLSSALPFILISWGLQHVTSGFAGVAMAAIPLMVLPLSHIFIPGERMGPRRMIGFTIGFIGVVILIGGQAFASSGAQLELLGQFACVSAALCYAGSSIMVRRLPPVDPVGLATALLLVGAVVILPAAYLVEGLPVMPDNETLFWLAVLGLIPTAAANLLRVLVIRGAGPVFMSLTNYQVPVWAVVLGAVFLGEPLPGSLLWALALILTGVGLSQTRALGMLFGKRRAAARR